jgi:hypothetical protein
MSISLRIEEIKKIKEAPLDENCQLSRPYHTPVRPLRAETFGVWRSHSSFRPANRLSYRGALESS